MPIFFKIEKDVPQPSGQLLLGCSASPFGSVYDRTGDTFAVSFDYIGVFTSICRDLVYSHDDIYLCRISNQNPFIHVYKDPNFTSSPLTIDALPAQGYSCDWSSDSIYLAVGHGGSPFVTVYKRSGDTFTKLSNPTSLPNFTVNDVEFDVTDTYLACGHAVGDRLTIYKRSGDTFTKLTLSSGLSATCYGVAWSSDSTYLACAISGSPYLEIYKRSGDTFTKLSEPSVAPSSTLGYKVAFDPDINYLTFVGSGTDQLTIYDINTSTDTFTKSSEPSIQPEGSSGTAIKFDKTGTYLAYGSNGLPYYGVYKIESGTFTKLTVPTGVGERPTSTVPDLSWSNK